jgi:hypothetical protein
MGKTLRGNQRNKHNKKNARDRRRKRKHKESVYDRLDRSYEKRGEV